MDAKNHRKTRIEELPLLVLSSATIFHFLKTYTLKNLEVGGKSLQLDKGTCSSLKIKVLNYLLPRVHAKLNST